MDGARSTIHRLRRREQSAATREISGNAGQAAAGDAAGQGREASGELAQQSEALRRELDSFIARVRAG